MSSYGMYGHEFKIGMGISNCFSILMFFFYYSRVWRKFGFYETSKNIFFVVDHSVSERHRTHSSVGEAAKRRMKKTKGKYVSKP